MKKTPTAARKAKGKKNAVEGDEEGETKSTAKNKKRVPAEETEEDQTDGRKTVPKRTCKEKQETKYPETKKGGTKRRKVDQPDAETIEQPKAKSRANKKAAVADGEEACPGTTPVENPKKRKNAAKTPEPDVNTDKEKEKQERAKKRSRKCCAYSKALKDARKAGFTEEEARQKASEAYAACE